MKIPPAYLLAVALASSPLFLTAVGAKEEEVINFLDMPRNSDGTYEKGYEYIFGDWEKKAVQIPFKGFLVNLTGSQGGVGDGHGLDFGKRTKARIVFILSGRSLARSFSLNLVDRDGTEQSFDVSLENLPRGVEQSVIVDLTKPSRETKPGSTPGLNLKKLMSWQLTGNFQSEPIEILFLRVAAVAE